MLFCFAAQFRHLRGDFQDISIYGDIYCSLKCSLKILQRYFKGHISLGPRIRQRNGIKKG